MELNNTEYKNDGKDKKNNFGGSIIFLVILITLTFYFLLKDQDISTLIKTVKKVNLIYIITGLIAVFTFISCEGMNIKILLNTLNKKTNYLRCLKYAFIGFFFSSITPSASGGQPMQVYYMKKDDINVSLSSLTLLIIVVIYQIIMICYGITAFLINPDFIESCSASINILLIYSIGINIVLISFILGAIFSDKIVLKIALWVISLLNKIKILKNSEKVTAIIKQQIEEYKNGANHIKKNPKIIAKVVLVTIIQLTAMYSVPYFVYKAYGLNTYSAVDFICLQSILSIAVCSLPLPGAVGALEGGFMVLFKMFFSQKILMSAMLLSRGISYYAFLIISGIISLGAHIISKKKETKAVKYLIKSYPSHIENS